MRIQELLEKTMAAPTSSQCSVGHARLSNVRYSQCVGAGYLKHDSDHTTGFGKQGVDGSGTAVRGRKLKTGKGTKNYGGDHS